MFLRHRHAIPTQESCGDRTTAPVGPTAEDQAKEAYSQALSFNVVCPIRFWTYLGSVVPFFLPISPPLEWEYLSYTCHTTVFWKHVTCLVSQVHSQRTVCFRMNHTWSVTHI